MNLCIITGKILEDINFKFIYNDRRISIAYTTIKLSNDSIITIKGFTEKADVLFTKFAKGDLVIVEGKIDTKSEVEIIRIDKIK